MTKLKSELIQKISELIDKKEKETYELEKDCWDNCVREPTLLKIQYTQARYEWGVIAGMERIRDLILL